MRIKTTNLLYILTFLLIILSLFASNNMNNNIFFIVYIALSFILILMHFYSNKINKKFFLLFSIVAIFVLIAFLIGKNGIVNMFINFSFLLILYIQFCVLKYPIIDKSDKILKIFYYLAFISIVLHTIYNIINIRNTSFNYYFISIIDKNYASVIVFLFCCLSIKLNKKVGLVFGLVLSLFFYSRLFLIGVLALIILWIIEKKKKGDKLFFNHPVKIFGLISILTIMTVFLSYYMAFSIPVNSIAKYRGSLNDESNAIRVRANVYAIEQVKNNWKFIFSGYDNSIRQAIGARGIWDSKMYMGFRLVQPHNFVLNFFLRYGVLLTVLYVALLSKLLSLFYNKENLKYIIPYLMMNMFMHSLLANIYLLFFIYILNINEKKQGDLHEKE